MHFFQFFDPNKYFSKFTLFSINYSSVIKFCTIMHYGSNYVSLIPIKHWKYFKNKKNIYFGNPTFSEKTKKWFIFLSLLLFFPNSPYFNIQLSRWHQIDQKILHTKKMSIRIFTQTNELRKKIQTTHFLIFFRWQKLYHLLPNGYDQKSFGSVAIFLVK